MHVACNPNHMNYQESPKMFDVSLDIWSFRHLLFTNQCEISLDNQFFTILDSNFLLEPLYENKVTWLAEFFCLDNTNFRIFY